MDGERFGDARARWRRGREFDRRTVDHTVERRRSFIDGVSALGGRRDERPGGGSRGPEIRRDGWSGGLEA
jgi:hypothetical protein